jgi:DNA-binding MarR family transcriptional regulator
MASIFEEMAGLDRLIHEPARLAIMSALSSVKNADFTFLTRLTGLTMGNLSSHLSKLEEAGLIKLEKKFVDKRPNTLVALTPRGQEAIENHWKQLDNLRENAKNWKPAEKD